MSDQTMSREKQIEEMEHEIRCLSYCEGYEDNRGCYIAPTCALCRINRENNADQISKALYNAGYRKQSEVAREIIGEILEGLQSEIDIEDKYGRNAWAQGDISDFQTHEYTEDKLETLIISLSLLKKKYTEGENG